VRLSRPCYDKMHRCPGWAGGGNRHARVQRCDNGRLRGSIDGSLYERRLWRWRFNRCTVCDVLVLPCAVRYVDPSNWWLEIRLWLMRHDGTNKGFYVERAEDMDYGGFAVAFNAGRVGARERQVELGVQWGRRVWAIGYAW